MHLFYHPGPIQELLNFSTEESRHISVLRLKPGDYLHVTDGRGLLCKAMVTDSSSQACQVQILERMTDQEPRQHTLHIAIAPTKQMERMEWFLEKATEIGISEITPVICRHAERRELKTDRLQKILVSAMKQSRRTWLPRLHEPVAVLDFLKNRKEPNKFIANAVSGKGTHLKNLLLTGQPVLVVIGPEGDFDPEELRHAISHGFLPAGLGPNRLRTETAGVFVSALVEILNS